MKPTAREENALPPTVTAATDPAAPPEGGHGWRVVLAAWFGVMVSFGSLLVFTFGIFLKPISAEFHWSRESVSAAFGFAALTVAVCSPFLGHLLDRCGPRRIILPCMAVFGLAYASLGLLGDNRAHLYATFILMGAVGNGTTQMGYARAVSTWFDRRRGIALAVVMAGTGAGAMIFPPVAQFLIDQYGWRNAYFTLGALVLICGIPLTALFVRERPRPAASASVPLAGATLSGALRSSAFWLIVSTLFLGSISVNGAITHLSPLLTDRGVTAATAALAASILGLSSFGGTGPHRRRPHRPGARWRSRHHALPPHPVLRPAVLLHSLRLQLDRLCRRRRHRPGHDGPRLRPLGFLHCPPHGAGSRGFHLRAAFPVAPPLPRQHHTWKHRRQRCREGMRGPRQ